MNRERQGCHISHVYSLWQDLSHHTIIIDLVILTLNFEPHTLNVAIQIYVAIQIWLPFGELRCLLTTLVIYWCNFIGQDQKLE